MSKSNFWIEREKTLARSFFDCSAVRPLFLIRVHYKDSDNVVYYSNDVIKGICADSVESVVINRVPRTELPKLIKRYSKVYCRFVRDGNLLIYG